MLLREYGQALSAFWQDMGDRMSDVAVVTMSEFGRTAHENGNRGTDHGHANCMFAMGGGGERRQGVRQVAGSGERSSSTKGRDLALTTDFRDVLGNWCAKHTGNATSEGVFPGYSPKFLGLVIGITAIIFPGARMWRNWQTRWI